jgi:hypothetical protein
MDNRKMFRVTPDARLVYGNKIEDIFNLTISFLRTNEEVAESMFSRIGIISSLIGNSDGLRHHINSCAAAR